MAASQHKNIFFQKNNRQGTSSKAPVATKWSYTYDDIRS
jgi:hypothetical protein